MWFLPVVHCRVYHVDHLGNAEPTLMINMVKYNKIVEIYLLDAALQYVNGVEWYIGLGKHDVLSL